MPPTISSRSSIDAIHRCLLALPEAAAWPDMLGVFDVAQQKPRPDWDLPLLACQAVGAPAEQAIPAAAAIACMQISIILTDDMLDNDPRGWHNQVGTGAAANMSLAFQAAAFRVLLQSEIGDNLRVALARELGWMGHATALGQHLDSENRTGEVNYWRVVEAKSTPFYGTAFYLGAVAGEAPPTVAGQLRQFGLLLGEMIQIQDDLLDALQSPANPDWLEGRNNLLLLYAQSIDHAERERFRQLQGQVADSASLHEAQQILMRSGAVSYAAFQIMARYEKGRQMLADLGLADAQPLLELLTKQIRLVTTLLQKSGIQV